MSERFYTLWREGKVIFGEHDVAVTTRKYKETIISSAIWFLGGGSLSPFDFEETKLFTREDGIPIHKQKHALGDLILEIEAFSDFGKTPNCYIKIKVTNPKEKSISEKIGFMLLTGLEHKLAFSGPDLYAIYNPTLADWSEISPTWEFCNGVYRDGERLLYSAGDINFGFSPSDGVSSAEITLLPGETKEHIFVFNIGEIPKFDYEDNKRLAISSWERELSRITKLPAKISENTNLAGIVKNLTAQLLQCFCLPKGLDIVFARQGGLQRQIWLYETMPVLSALSRLGSFDSYIEPVIDSYFTEFYTDSGKIEPLAIPWAMSTANAISSFSEYASYRGREYFERYIERVAKSFRWISHTRMTEEDAKPLGLIAGLFPPMASCDAQFVFQSWAITDTFNIKALRDFRDVCGKYGYYELYHEADTVLDEYRGVMKSVWDGMVKTQREANEPLFLPYCPSLPDEIVKQNFAFEAGLAYFVEALDIELEIALELIEAYTARGVIRGGLYDKMPNVKNSSGLGENNVDKNGVCYVWYVGNSEYFWFNYFLRHGMIEKCDEILRDLMKFAMTDEYYMFERYHRANVWFAPWSPNASANGRMINMLIDRALLDEKGN